MHISLSDALVLAGVLAILLINYSNRRAATAGASRMLVKDRMKNVRHAKHDKTMLVLRSRLSLQSGMLSFAALGGFLAVVSAGFVVFELQFCAKVVFVAALVAGAISLLQSFRESAIANRAHFGELDATVAKDDPYYRTIAP